MDPSKKTGSRYNKVNQQKKFYLLTLIYKQHLPVREVLLTPYRQPKSLASTTSLPRPLSSSTKTTIKPTSSTSRTPTTLGEAPTVSGHQLLPSKN